MAACAAAVEKSRAPQRFSACVDDNPALSVTGACFVTPRGGWGI